MLIKIGDCWVDPEEVVAIYPDECSEFAPGDVVSTAVVFRGAEHAVFTHCRINEAVDALQRAGYIADAADEEAPPEPVELSSGEREELSTLLAYGYEWIARDRDGKAFAYWAKPEKDGPEWGMRDAGESNKPVQRLGAGQYLFLDWEDEAPRFIPQLLGREDR